MEDFILSVITVLAVVLPAISIYVAYKLFKASRSERGKGVTALRERANTAIVLAVSGVCGAILGINRAYYLATTNTFLSPTDGLFLLSIIIIATSLPGIFWLYEFRKE